MQQNNQHDSKGNTSSNNSGTSVIKKMQTPIPAPVFIPSILKGAYNWFIGQYLYEDDDFIQIVRKVAIAMVALSMCQGGPLMFGWFLYLYVQFQHVSDLLFVIFGGVMMALSFLDYILLRQKRHATDLMALLFIGCGTQLMFFGTFYSSGLDLPATHAAIISGSIIVKAPCLPLTVLLHLTASVIGSWNQAWQFENPDWVLRIPDTRVVQGWEMFALQAFALGPVLAIIIAVYFARQEQLRQVESAKNSVNLAHSVVDHLRRYDTDSVHQLVEDIERSDDEENNSDVNNPALLRSFEDLASNLEKYRPFLPNYLFLGSEDEGEVEDDENGGEKFSDVSSTEGVRSVKSRQQQDASSSRKYMSGGGQLPNSGSRGRVGRRPSTHSTSSHQSKKQSSKHSIMIPPLTSCANAWNSHSTSIQQAHNHHHLSSSLGKNGGAAPSIFYSRTNIAMALVEVRPNDWFSQHVSAQTLAKYFNKTPEQQQDSLQEFTAMLYEIASRAKASVHSLIGDTVQLSWNATHRVAQCEVKAATFLLELRNAARSSASGSMHVNCAAAAGTAEVHSVFSQTTKQQALFIDAPWLPVLKACYKLAKSVKTSSLCDEDLKKSSPVRDSFSSVIVDENIYNGCTFQTVGRPVDCIRFVPQVQVSLSRRESEEQEEAGAQTQTQISRRFTAKSVPAGSKSRPLGFDPRAAFAAKASSTKELSPGDFSFLVCGAGDSQRRESVDPHISGGGGQDDEEALLRYTVAYELTKLRSLGEEDALGLGGGSAMDEWMYQLQAQEEELVGGGGCGRLEEGGGCEGGNRDVEDGKGKSSPRKPKILMTEEALSGAVMELLLAGDYQEARAQVIAFVDTERDQNTTERGDDVIMNGSSSGAFGTGVITPELALPQSHFSSVSALTNRLIAYVLSQK